MYSEFFWCIFSVVQDSLIFIMVLDLFLLPFVRGGVYFYLNWLDYWNNMQWHLSLRQRNPVNRLSEGALTWYKQINGMIRYILYLLHILLPYLIFYIKIYQFSKIHDKGFGLQVRKFSYSPPPAQINNNQMDMAIQHICTVFKKSKESL